MRNLVKEGRDKKIGVALGVTAISKYIFLLLFN
jgi:hypothetical protein